MSSAPRHLPPPADAVAFYSGPFSNFAVSPFTLPDPHTGAPREYRTVEHYFQACKASGPADHAGIAAQPTPRDAKRAGRVVALRADWEDVKLEVMLTGLRAKFALPKFRDALLATGDALLLEDSPYDFEWGARDATGGWGGQNLLGVALRQLRAEIRDAGPQQGEQIALL